MLASMLQDECTPNVPVKGDSQCVEQCMRRSDDHSAWVEYCGTHATAPLMFASNCAHLDKCETLASQLPYKELLTSRC